jgi:hypothetical protein
MATVEDVRAIALGLPRTEEYVLRGRLKYRVGRIVYLALSADETEIGFGYPREERDGLVASEPAKFFLPRRASDLRYHWVEAWLGVLEPDELRELVVEAWRMCVPKRLGATVP